MLQVKGLRSQESGWMCSRNLRFCQKKQIKFTFFWSPGVRDDSRGGRHLVSCLMSLVAASVMSLCRLLCVTAQCCSYIPLIQVRGEGIRADGVDVNVRSNFAIGKKAGKRLVIGAVYVCFSLKRFDGCFNVLRTPPPLPSNPSHLFHILTTDLSTLHTDCIDAHTHTHFWVVAM